jgi:multidrug efflux system membrane fusion protein
VVIKIIGGHAGLRSGLAADVTFQFSSGTAQSDTVVLPVGVVINSPDGTFVFIAEPAENSGEAIARKRKVSLGELSQRGVEVVSGLQPGDHVITAGITVIRDGQRVLMPKAK